VPVESPPARVPRSRPDLEPLPAPGREVLARLWANQRVAAIAFVVGVVVLGLVVAALADRLAYRNRVLPGVVAGHVDLGGMTVRGAREALREEAARLESTPISVRAGQTQFSVDPTALGLKVDVPVTVRRARLVGRSRNPLAQVAGTVLRRSRDDRVPLAITVDRGRLEGVLDGWVAQTGKGLVDGGLRFEGAEVVEIAPRRGIGIRREEARAAVLAALARGDSAAGRLAIGDTTPAIDLRDVRRTARKARKLLSAPVVVTANGVAIPLPPEQVASTLSTEIVESRLVLRSDPAKLRVVMAPALASIETAPKDAGFTVAGSTVSVVPAVTGQLADLDLVARRVGAGQHEITAPMEPVEPARSTAWAQQLNITELVSSYTTNHPCCAPRVDNIHTAAEAIDGTIVEPGATFSLNGALGPRTTEKGYVAAPAIGADLEYEDSVGGGVSQLSTTLYNASFFGCYKDVTHTVHALYITRYPMGREATLNYPSIDNRFRNDSGSGVLIRTFYSSTSITVALYGNKEGRSCKAEGPNVLETIPPAVEYVDDPALPAGTEKELSPGHTGYAVENFRVISRAGQPDERERYLERYSMTPRKIARGTSPPPPPPAPPAPAPAPPPA